MMTKSAVRPQIVYTKLIDPRIPLKYIVPFILGFVGCTPSVDDQGTTNPLVTFDDDDDKPTDTAVPLQDLTGQKGSIVVTHYPSSFGFDDETYTAVGLFTDGDGGLLNMSHCLLLASPCVTELPAIGESITEDPSATTFLNSIGFYDVGDPIFVGDHTLNIDPNYTVEVYISSLSGFGTGTGIQLDGDFMPYAGSDDFAFTDMIDATSPPIDAELVVGPGETVDFAWTPGGAGDVYLTVADTLHHLDDSGAFTLNVDDLELAAPLATVYAQLSRQTHTEVDAAGNTLQVQTTSEQWYTVNYEDLEGWTELELDVSWTEDCDGAKLISPIAPGQYYGDLTDLVDDHDLGYNNPTTGWATEGFEGVTAFDLLAGQTLTATMKQIVYDAAVYVLDDDCDPSNPLAGTDDTLDGQEEVVEYTATDDETVYLVLDGWFEGGTFSLVVDVQ